jgi:hypothetical protein
MMLILFTFLYVSLLQHLACGEHSVIVQPDEWAPKSGAAGMEPGLAIAFLALVWTVASPPAHFHFILPCLEQ